MASKDSSDEDQSWKPSARRSKRLKTMSGRIAKGHSLISSISHIQTPHLSLDPLLNISFVQVDFENIFPRDDYLAARTRQLESTAETDAYGYQIRPLTPAEIHGLPSWLQKKIALGTPPWTNGDAILARRLQLHKLTNGAPSVSEKHRPHPRLMEPSISPPARPPLADDALSALRSICKTTYECSFASRLCGSRGQSDANIHLIHRDFESLAPWIDLLEDIRLHYYLSHPGCDQADEVIAPIDYVSLQQWHLPQVHDLLDRIFWPGIDVSDCLYYARTQCTVVSLYKRLVVGAAFLSSPEETYLTYLVVRPGWENANIATVMLHYLITKNPSKDITLHVSANNSAMLLYNKFGFKAEEFIVGFYEDYLAPESRACKNAFRLRLRR